MDGGYGASRSRYPRMGRSDWTTDDLGYYGDLSDRGYGDDTRRYARGAGRGYYPSDNPSYRGGYGRTERNRDRDEERGFMDRAGDEVASWFGDDEAARRREMDSHRGKGPRGYRRSDSRILEDVNDRLSDDGSVDASDIEVTVKDGEVTLSGHVTDRWEKRRAEDCADDVSGVTHVQNNLRVRTSGEGSVVTQA
ncbi:MAG: BON domain-containing protein [Rhizobiales bacterium]|nr:BON domain-containing protein [Hyphomicrobiales bacterium]